MPTTIVSARSHRVRIAPHRKTVAIGRGVEFIRETRQEDRHARGEANG